MRYRERENTQEDINLSPLIDIVFILLIFFMVSATFVKDMDLDLNRPKATSSTPSSSKAIRVFIDKQGNTFVDGQAVRIWVLQSKLRELLHMRTSSNVLIVTDDNVPSGKLIEVIDQSRLAGAEDVGVVTDNEMGQ